MPGELHSKNSKPKSKKDGRGIGSVRDRRGRIKVAVRLRPFLPKDKLKKSIIHIVDKKMVVVLDPAKFLEKDEFLRQKRSREKRYAFDVAFEAETTQRQVYQKTVEPNLDSVLDGINVSVFAYGATGSGKTHTMLGTVEKPGMMFLTMKDLFDRMEKKKKDFKYRVILSYLEVYNENIRDLLHPSDEYLELREDSDKMQVVGLSEVEVNNENQIMSLLRKGNKNRIQEPTHLNETSSRSHAVLQVTVEQHERTQNAVEEVRIAKLSLIDLAGSERAAASHNKGIRLLEGANINRSLLALGNCINALGHRHNKGGYIPYRDSKLTRLLKDSLGGNCRTVMIATLSPSHINCEDTINTLKYANRAKHIKTKVVRNIVSLNNGKNDAHYNNIISDLRDEVSNLKKKLILTRERSKRDLRIHMQKMATDKSFDKLKKELVLNFEEMMQARKSMAELEALEVENRININRIQMIISDSNINMNQIRKYKKELNTLIWSMKRNAKMKNEFMMKYSQLEDLAMSLKEKLKTSASSNRDLQESLSHLFRLHLVELQNTELSAIHDKQTDLLKERDLDIQKLRLQLKLRDSILRKQAKKLADYGIDTSDIPEAQVLLRYHGELQVPQDNLSVSPALSMASSDASSQISAQSNLNHPGMASHSTTEQQPNHNNLSEQATLEDELDKESPTPMGSLDDFPPGQTQNNAVITSADTVHNTNNNYNIQINQKHVFHHAGHTPSKKLAPSQKLKAKRLKRQRLAIIYGSGKVPKKTRKKKKKTMRRSTPIPHPTYPTAARVADQSLFVSRFNSDFNEIYQDVIPASPSKKEKSQKLSRKPRNLEQHNRLMKHRQKRAKRRPKTLEANFRSDFESLSQSFAEQGSPTHHKKKKKTKQYPKRNSSVVVTRFPPILASHQYMKERALALQ